MNKAWRLALLCPAPASALLSPSTTAASPCLPLPALPKPFELGHRERRPGVGFPPTSPLFLCAFRRETFLSGHSLPGLGRLLPDKTHEK